MKKLFIIFIIGFLIQGATASIVGATKGSTNVQQGSLNYNLEIITPKGTAGVKPSLSINYNSSNSVSSIIGVGFSLSGLSSISKCDEKLADYCLDGQKLIILDDGTYRTKINNHSKIIKLDSSWQVFTKDGLIKEYGNTIDSKDKETLFRLNEIKDRFDNKIDFKYSNTNDNKYIKQITYSNNTIYFIYEDKDDKEVLYTNGVKVNFNQRLKAISIKTNDTEVSSYNFIYEYINNRSTLTSIQECSQQQCLEPLNFNWLAQNNTNKVNDATTWFNNSDSSLKDWKLFAQDINGDSLPDLVQTYKGTNGHKFKVSLNNGNSFEEASLWINESDSSLNDWEIYAQDLNGDLLPDLVQSYKGSNGHKFKVSLNEGSGFSQGVLWLNDSDSSLKDYKIYAQDINRDSRPDLIQSYKGSSGHKLKVSLNNGNGFDQTITLFNDSDSSLSDWEVYLLDINGDLLPDVIQSYKGSSGHKLKVSLNLGDNEFGQASYWLNDNDGSLSSWELYTQDINGDSLPDLVQSYKGSSGHKFKVSLNTGLSFESPTYWLEDNDGSLSDWNIYTQDINGDSLPDLIQSYKGSSGHKYKVSINTGTTFAQSYYLLNESDASLTDWEIYAQDLNGDSLPDIVQSYKGSSGHKFKVSTNSNKILKVNHITNYKNEDVKVVYSTLNDSSVYESLNDAVYPKVEVKSSGIKVVKELITKTANDNDDITRYFYSGFKVQVKKGSLGFKTIRTTNELTKSESIVNYMQEYPLVGVVSSSANYINDIKISDTTSDMQVTKYYQNKDISNLETLQTVQNKYDIDGTYLLTTQTNNSNFDKYGNIGKIETITTDANEEYKKVTTNTYTNDEDKWILSRLTNAYVSHYSPDSSTITKNSSFQYDNQTGILTKETIEPLNAKALTKTYLYNKYGNKIQETLTTAGQESRVSKFEYDIKNKNITTVINSLGHTEFREYDINNQLVKLKDINGLITTFAYDSMGKKIKETRADGTVTTWTHSWDNSLANSLYKVTQTSTGIPSVTTYFNKLNKKLRTVKTSFDGLKIYEDTHYNDKGLAQKSTMPYYSGDKVAYIYNYYDDLGRQIQLQRIDSNGEEVNTYYEYGKFDVTTINPKGIKKTIYNNIINKKIKVVEGDTFIEYKYDSAGNLVQTTDIKNNQIKLKYDIFGNKIYQDDPDMGIWTYEYNGYGELISQRDAKGQVTSMQYDKLGREVKRTSNDGITTYAYDIAANGIGKIALEQAENYKKEYFYDKLSRLKQSIEYIDNKQFITKYKYNKEGKLHQTIYPNGFVLENEYNTQGYLSGLKSPLQNNIKYTQEKLKELLQQALENKSDTFEKLIQLQTQIEQYKTKAIIHLNLAKKFEGVDEAINKQLIDNANFLIKTSIELKEQSQQHKINYNRYTKELNYYLAQVTKYQDEYLYKWLSELFSKYTTTLLDNAKSKLDEASGLLEGITTKELLDTYKEITAYYIDEAKTLILEAKRVSQNYKNYNQKYINLTTNQDKAYQGMFDNSGYKYYYKILKTDVFGRITKDAVGNGLVTTKTYDSSNGQLKRIQTGYNQTNDIRDIKYQYDKLNNVTQKQDLHQNITQNFTYDTLDRIKQATTNNNGVYQTITYNYDQIGNIIYKSDVGEYTYSNKPHQVTTAGNNTYTYDANGNVIQKNDTTIEYNSYNKPTLIKDSKNSTQFFYAPSKQRYKKILNQNTTYYVGKLYEQENTNSSIIYKNYIYAGKELVAIHTKEDDGNLILPQNRYLHKDSLGSIDTITNESGVVIQRLAYQPFGKRIVQSWINDSTSNAIVKRGFTGHEHIQEHGLIHMNGRVYDETIGRFLSADPHIQAPYDTQSFNRYSYVKNNPLKYIDPSGYFFSSITRAFKKVVSAVKKYASVIVTVAVAYYAPYMLGYVKTAGAVASLTFAQAATVGALAGAAGAIVGTKVNGGSWGDALKSGVKGAIVGGISAGVAQQIGHGSGIFKTIRNSGALGKPIMHGLSRAAIAKAQGNKTSSAFWSGFATSAISPFRESVAGDSYVANVAFSAVTAGTVSEISGGRFANGAVTGAFIYMFNDALEEHNALVMAIEKTTPNQTIYISRDTWKCDDKYWCSLLKGMEEGFDYGDKAGDFVDAWYNNFDVFKNVGRIVGPAFGGIKASFEYDERQEQKKQAK